jgi:Colicin V production protein.
MNPIDFAIIIVLFVGFVWGFTKGFVSMIFSLLAILAGIFGAGKLVPLILPHLFSAQYGQLGYIVLFVILFTLIYFIIKKITYLIEDMVAFLELEWLDSLLGGIIGLFQIWIIAGVILSITYNTGAIRMLPQWEEIKIGGVVSSVSQNIIHLIAGNLAILKIY